MRAGDALAELAEQPVDLVWASDVVWPGNFPDPAAAVAALLAGVRPGGTVALLYSGYYQASFLPGHARLELLVRLASFHRWGLPDAGPHHHDRPLAWLLGAGAVGTAVRVFPRIGFAAELAVHAYLEGTVWPELRASAAEHGTQAGLTDADLAELTTRDDPRYAPDQPGYHVVQPAVLVTGRRPS